MIGAHKTHCCIEHKCKYGDEDCPVVLGIIKQDYQCELCAFDTGCFGEAKLTEQEQQEHLDALWEEKHNPKVLDPLESSIAEIAKKYGRLKVLAIVKAVSALPVDCEKIIEVLESLKAIK